MASDPPPVGSPPAALALLHAIARRDLPAVQQALEDGAEQEWEGVTALHVCALCDWPKPVPLLLAHGAHLEARLSPDLEAQLQLGVNSLVALRAAAHLGAPEGMYSAAQTPLMAAISCGAVDAASALLAAGASTADVLAQLVSLAAQKTQQLGAQAASVILPPLVQRCAAMLLAAGLPAGPELAYAHVAAAHLAFPFRSPENNPLGYRHCFPACPWLLEQLLQRHCEGQVPEPAAAVWMACEALLECAEERWFSSAGDHSALSGALVDWLSLPAAGGMQGEWLASLLMTFCQCRSRGIGVVGLNALRALLALAPMHALLRAEATQSIALGWPEVDAVGHLVYSAASTGCPEVLDAVLAAGGAVTLNVVLSAAARFDFDRTPDVAALQLLLSRAQPRPPRDALVLQPAPGPDLRRAYLACPVYAVLELFFKAMHQCGEVHHVMASAAEAQEPPAEEELHQLHCRALAVMECLADAGYRPNAYVNYPLGRRGRRRGDYNPAASRRLAERWELGTASRWLWLAARREPWSPERHTAFPPAFKQAARTLLLAAHRGASAAGAVQQRGKRSGSSARGAGGGSTATGIAQLARLPRELLHAILARAAYPVSAWQPQMEGGRVLDEVRAWKGPSMEGPSQQASGE